MKKLVFVPVVLLLLLIGCSSVEQFFDATLAGVSVWYAHPQTVADKNQIAFVGEGKAGTERQAELIAYATVIDNISDYLGVELHQRLYKELSTIGTIEEFGASVAQTSVEYDEKKQIYTARILVLGDRELLDSVKTDIAKESEIATEKVIELVLQGDEYIRTNRDIMGVKSYLQAMAYSYNLEKIAEEYSFEVLKNEVLRIISSMRIVLRNINTETTSCDIFITRTETVLSSYVQNGALRAVFNAVNISGELYEDSFRFMTDDSGSFDFSTLDYGMNTEGTIRFELDLNDELEVISKLDEEAFNEIKNAADKVSVFMDYVYDNKIGSMGVFLETFEQNGDAAGIDCSGYFITKLKSRNTYGIKINAEQNSSDEEILGICKKDSIPSNAVLIARVGVFDSYISEATGAYVVNSLGRATLYNLSTGEILYYTGDLYSNGMGSDFASAQESAFTVFSDIVFNLIKVAYVL